MIEEIHHHHHMIVHVIIHFIKQVSHYFFEKRKNYSLFAVKKSLNFFD